MNPIKANIVEDIANYRWSSYRHNARGEPDKLITEHDFYKVVNTTQDPELFAE